MSAHSSRRTTPQSAPLSSPAVDSQGVAPPDLATAPGGGNQAAIEQLRLIDHGELEVDEEGRIAVANAAYPDTDWSRLLVDRRAVPAESVVEPNIDIGAVHDLYEELWEDSGLIPGEPVLDSYSATEMPSAIGEAFDSLEVFGSGDFETPWVDEGISDALQSPLMLGAVFGALSFGTALKARGTIDIRDVVPAGGSIVTASRTTARSMSVGQIRSESQSHAEGYSIGGNAGPAPKEGGGSGGISLGQSGSSTTSSTSSRSVDRGVEGALTVEKEELVTLRGRVCLEPELTRANEALGFLSRRSKGPEAAIGTLTFRVPRR